jgi:hypothetical protein
VPLVLAADGRPRAWTADGALALPEDAAYLLGADHLRSPTWRATSSRSATTSTPATSRLGWQFGPVSVSFPHENGAHAGPGPEETDAFVLAPADAPIAPPAEGPLRPLQLREAALRVLARAPALPRAPAVQAPGAGDGRIRLVTYPVHSCVGLDGRLSPARIARVLAPRSGRRGAAGLTSDASARAASTRRRHRGGTLDGASFHLTFALEEEQFGDAVLAPARLVKRHRCRASPRSSARRSKWSSTSAGARSSS